MELRGAELSCYLNNIRSVGLWKCLYDHCLANKAYFSAITVKNIYESFTRNMAAKASWHWNYVTVTLCIISIKMLNCFPTDAGRWSLSSRCSHPNQLRSRVFQSARRYFWPPRCPPIGNNSRVDSSGPTRLGRDARISTPNVDFCATTRQQPGVDYS